MNIDGLGPETVDMFYRLGLIENTADLYKLTADDIKGLDRMGEKSPNGLPDHRQRTLGDGGGCEYIKTIY